MYSSNDLKSKYGEKAFIALTNCIGLSVVHDSSMLPSSSPSLENRVRLRRGISLNILLSFHFVKGGPPSF